MLTNEHRLLRDTLRDFAQQRLAPFAAEWDRNASFPREALAELAALGTFGIAVPDHYGGAGMDYLALAIALEEIAAGDGATSTIISVNNCPVCSILMGWANEEQKRRYLVPLARGEMLGAFCLTEPHVGSEASGLRTTARRDGDFYVLDGVKQFITSGKHGDVAIVMAVTDRSAGKRGISAFLVETATPGYIVARLEEKMGQHASDTAQILLEDCRVPAANLHRRRRRGLQDRAVRPGGRAHRHRLAIARHGARGVRGGAALCEGTRRVRQADLRAPGGAVPARRHGHADRSRAPADPACRPAEGRRPALPEGSGDGEAVRVARWRNACARTRSRSTAATAT